MLETTIPLRKEEFKEFEKEVEGKRVVKTRFEIEINGKISEIDVFRENLEGLVVIDFEFENKEEKDAFKMPDFCVVNITNEEFTAGGIICGKKYSDIEENLNRFNYKKLDNKYL